MIELLTILPAMLCAIWLATFIYALKFKSDAEAYRASWLDLRALLNWEREQTKWLRAELEAERKRQKDGPYR